MTKIIMKNPIVEMDGDEMTRILWQNIKDTLLQPFVELNTFYFDLGLPNRDATDDAVTMEAARAAMEVGVSVKCATITPNAARMSEYNLKEMYKSPNATIRAHMDGTVFRAPIMIKRIPAAVRSWEGPITIARHAYGDIYKAVEAIVPKGATANLVVRDQDGGTQEYPVHDFAKGGGVVLGMHNTDASIDSFARACFEYALSTGQDLWFATKDTISKVYDDRFLQAFAAMFEAEYKDKFAAAGIEYFYTLIDDAVSRVIRSKGNFIWACKNYDGDVMSDMVATAFGSLSMMSSVLVSPSGAMEFEAAHGTVTRHYYRYLKGETPSTNPVATIFAWSGALRRRGELDDQDELMKFADLLERATTETIEGGIMTGDLAGIATGNGIRSVNTQEFLEAIAARMRG